MPGHSAKVWCPCCHREVSARTEQRHRKQAQMKNELAASNFQQAEAWHPPLYGRTVIAPAKLPRVGEFCAWISPYNLLTSFTLWISLDNSESAPSGGASDIELVPPLLGDDDMMEEGSTAAQERQEPDEGICQIRTTYAMIYLLCLVLVSATYIPMRPNIETEAEEEDIEEEEEGEEFFDDENERDTELGEEDEDEQSGISVWDRLAESLIREAQLTSKYSLS